MQMNSADAYRDVRVGRPAFHKRSMRYDKPNSQNNEIRSDENNYYSLRRRTNSTTESSEVALQNMQCIYTLKDKAETNTLTSHLKLVMTALIAHLFFMKIKFAG